MRKVVWYSTCTINSKYFLILYSYYVLDFSQYWPLTSACLLSTFGSDGGFGWHYPRNERVPVIGLLYLHVARSGRQPYHDHERHKQFWCWLWKSLWTDARSVRLLWLCRFAMHSEMLRPRVLCGRWELQLNNLLGCMQLRGVLAFDIGQRINKANMRRSSEVMSKRCTRPRTILFNQFYANEEYKSFYIL